MGFRTVIIKNRAKLEFRLNSLIVRGDTEKKIYISEINTLIIQSTAVSLTASLLNELTKNNVKVIFCDEKCNPVSELLPYYGAHNTSRRYKEQFLWDKEIKARIWRKIVQKKIEEQSSHLFDRGFIEQSEMLKEYALQVCDNDYTNREGHAAKVYFNCLLGIGNSRQGGGFVNGCLNYGYSVLLSAFNREIIPSVVANELGLGADKNDTDIYFGASINFAEYYMDMMMNKFGASSLLLDLTDFMANWLTYDEQNKMGEIIDAGLISMLSIADKEDDSVQRIFSLPWAGGACGLVYNADIFAEVGVEPPETTDELLALMDEFIKYNASHPDKTPIMPIIYAGANAMAYWQYLTYVWWAQYEGYDQFMKYWTLTDGDPFDPNKDYIVQEGQLEAMKVSEKLIRGEYVYKASEGLTDEIAEKYFIKGDDTYRFAMMPNGDWFENEAKSYVGEVPDSFKMMKTPKLSSAVTKYKGVNNVPDYAYTLASTHNVFIPSYTREKDLALDFLSFYYSETGAKIFYEHTGAFLPRTNYDYLSTADRNKMTKFKQSELELIETVDFVFTAEYKSPVRYFGGLPIIPDGKATPEKMMMEGKSAQTVWEEYNAFFKSGWNGFLDNAGI